VELHPFNSHLHSSPANIIPIIPKLIQHPSGAPIPCKHIPSHPIHPSFHPNNMKIHPTNQQMSPADIYATHFNQSIICQILPAHSSMPAMLLHVLLSFCHSGGSVDRFSQFCQCRQSFVSKGLGTGRLQRFAKSDAFNVGTQWGSLLKVVPQVAGKNCLQVSLDWSKGKKPGNTPSLKQTKNGFL